MIRFILPAFFMLALMTNGISVRAEEAAPESAAEPAAEQPAEKEEEPKAEEKSAAEKPAEEKKAEEKNPAEDAPEAKKYGEDEVPPGIRQHRKASEEALKITKEIADTLGNEEKKHFFLLYSNYNMIGTVKMVEENITNTTKSCGEKNPAMKEGIDADLAEWKSVVDPVIKEAEANINNMVIAQNYAKPAEIKKLFKSLDKTRKLADKAVDKVPVTSKDGCERFQETMSDTQENLVEHLHKTLISLPQAMPLPLPEPAAGGKEQAKEKPAKAAKEEAAKEESAKEEKPAEEEAH